MKYGRFGYRKCARYMYNDDPLGNQGPPTHAPTVHSEERYGEKATTRARSTHTHTQE
jgi:hypothetical protein